MLCCSLQNFATPRILTSQLRILSCLQQTRQWAIYEMSESILIDESSDLTDWKKVYISITYLFIFSTS